MNDSNNNNNKNHLNNKVLSFGKFNHHWKKSNVPQLILVVKL